MKAVLDAVLPSLGLGYTCVNVDRSPALLERFSDVVPVLLRDGRAVAKVRLDEETLRRLVARSRRFD